MKQKADLVDYSARVSQVRNARTIVAGGVPGVIVTRWSRASSFCKHKGE